MDTHLIDLDADLRDCIAQCTACHQACTELVSHCLDRGGEHAARAHINLLLACADICRTSADTMLRQVPQHAATCRACAELCTACADECARMGSDDPVMQRCAEICRACAESCEEMAG
ncbi:four-helix bundle copper-binding protein [Coralloluteibacterium thermophilus]|uniref:Four-helix bundle copper-binding protein n=1 Tax=Coralloluteibacterium thermophilum TaxID=2707049 RepID=A0ABV9NL04_9GAMM